MGKAKEPLVEVRRSRIHGNGVFALRTIRKDQLILEYLGQRIEEDEARERYQDDKMKRHHTFLFGLSNGSYLDANHEGNEARFINHSCEPNCYAVEKKDRIFIYALHTLQAGDELLYDYNLTREGPPKKSWKKLYACHCGAPSCRGTMLYVEPKKGRMDSKGMKGKKA